MLERAARLMAKSAWAARLLARHPILLDELTRTAASFAATGWTAERAALSVECAAMQGDVERILDHLRHFKQRHVLRFTIADLEGAIRRTSPGGSTSLHNAIYIALKELKKIQARSNEDIRRQAIVVLSDGEDTSSLVSFDEVLELAKRSETAIYAIGLRSRGPERARGSFNESDFVLRQLAQETGGKAFFARSVAGRPAQAGKASLAAWTAALTSASVPEATSASTPCVAGLIVSK